MDRTQLPESGHPGGAVQSAGAGNCQAPELRVGRGAGVGVRIGVGDGKVISRLEGSAAKEEGKDL